MLTNLMWFLLGSLVCMLLSITFLGKQYNKIVDFLSALTSVVIHSMHTEIKSAAKVKHAHMKMSDLPDDVLYSIIKKDSQFLSTWRQTAFFIIHSNLPIAMKNKFQFLTLDEATKILDIDGEKKIG